MGKKELVEKIQTGRMVVSRLEEAHAEPRSIGKATLTLIGWEKLAVVKGIDLSNI